VDVQVGRCSNGGTEPEDDVEDVESDGNDGDVEAVEEGCRQQIEERCHAEGCCEHIIVDHGRVALVCRGYHVTYKAHHNDGADELQARQSKVSQTKSRFSAPARSSD